MVNLIFLSLSELVSAVYFKRMNSIVEVEVKVCLLLVRRKQKKENAFLSFTFVFGFIPRYKFSNSKTT